MPRAWRRLSGEARMLNLSEREALGGYQERSHALPGTGLTAPGSSDQRSSFLRWPLRALAWPYGLAVRARTALYERGWLPRRRLPCRVVSVGNLTVGGTGKTPVVISIAEWLLARGKRVGVLSRGYRRRSRAPQLLVSDGRTILEGPAEAGDEPHLIAWRCPGAVVAVGTDRYRLGRWVLERFPIDCFVLDDGFQHLALHRDVDLLLIDASDPAGLEALLPAGRLREPLSAAARATALLLTRADAAAGPNTLLASIRAATGSDSRPILIRFIPEALVNMVTGMLEAVASAAGGPAGGFRGGGESAAFPAMVGRPRPQGLHEVVVSGHHASTPQEPCLVMNTAWRCGCGVIA